MIAARILAVVAALLFVLAFALALMLPAELPLGQAVATVDQHWVAALQDAVRKGVPDWVWVNLVVPMLLRPAWLLPVAMGMVTGGAAVSLATRRSAGRSRHRRS